MSGMLTNESSSSSLLYSSSLSSFSLGERGSPAGGRLLRFCFCFVPPTNEKNDKNDDDDDDKDGNKDDISVYIYIDNDLGGRNTCKFTCNRESSLSLWSVPIPTIAAGAATSVLLVTAGAAKVVAVVLAGAAAAVGIVVVAGVNNGDLLSCECTRSCSVPEQLSTERSLGETGRVTGVLQPPPLLFRSPPPPDVAKPASFFSQWSRWPTKKNLRFSLLLLLLLFVRLLRVLLLLLVLVLMLLFLRFWPRRFPSAAADPPQN